MAGMAWLGLWGCREEEEGGARVRVPLAGYAREGVHPVYLFAGGEGEKVARYWRVDGTVEGVEAELPLGRYGLGIIAGAGTRDEVRLEEGYALEEVGLYLTEREGYFREASDAWTGWAEVKVEEDTRVLPAVSLARQTAGLEVRLTGMPEGVTNPWLVVLPVATERSFAGRTGMGRGRMSERMEVAGEGEATGVVRLFPTGEGTRVYVAYSTERETLHKRLPDLPALDTGEVARVACVFGDLPDEEPGGGTEEEVPHGVNLLVNGDFEWWTPGALAPDGWSLYRDGRDSAVVGVTGTEVFSGEGAVRLEGKTYLYKDVE